MLNHNYLSLKRKIAIALLAFVAFIATLFAVILPYISDGSRAVADSDSGSQKLSSAVAAKPYRNYYGAELRVAPYGDDSAVAVVYKDKTTIGNLKTNLVVKAGEFRLLNEEYTLYINGHAYADAEKVPCGEAGSVAVAVEAGGKTVSLTATVRAAAPAYTDITATVAGTITDDVTDVKRFLTVQGTYDSGEDKVTEHVNSELYDVTGFSSSATSITVTAGSASTTVNNISVTHAQMTGASLLVKTEGYRRPDPATNKYERLKGDKWYSAFVTTASAYAPTRAEVFAHLNVYALYPNSARLLNITDYSTNQVANVKDTNGNGNYTVLFQDGTENFNGANSKTLNIRVDGSSVSLQIEFEERKIISIRVDGNNQGEATTLYPYTIISKDYFNGCVKPTYNNGVEDAQALDPNEYTVEGSLTPPAEFLLTSPDGGKYDKDVTVRLATDSTVTAKGSLRVTWSNITDFYKRLTYDTSLPEQTMRTKINLERLYATLYYKAQDETEMEARAYLDEYRNSNNIKLRVYEDGGWKDADLNTLVTNKTTRIGVQFSYNGTDWSNEYIMNVTPSKYVLDLPEFNSSTTDYYEGINRSLGLDSINGIKDGAITKDALSVSIQAQQSDGSFAQTALAEYNKEDGNVCFKAGGMTYRVLVKLTNEKDPTLLNEVRWNTSSGNVLDAQNAVYFDITINKGDFVPVRFNYEQDKDSWVYGEAPSNPKVYGMLVSGTEYDLNEIKVPYTVKYIYNRYPTGVTEGDLIGKEFTQKYDFVNGNLVIGNLVGGKTLPAGVYSVVITTDQTNAYNSGTSAAGTITVKQRPLYPANKNMSANPVFYDRTGHAASEFFDTNAAPATATGPSGVKADYDKVTDVLEIAGDDKLTQSLYYEIDGMFYFVHAGSYGVSLGIKNGNYCWGEGVKLTTSKKFELAIEIKQRTHKLEVKQTEKTLDGGAKETEFDFSYGGNTDRSKLNLTFGYGYTATGATDPTIKDSATRTGKQVEEGATYNEFYATVNTPQYYRFDNKNDYDNAVSVGNATSGTLVTGTPDTWIAGYYAVVYTTAVQTGEQKIDFPSTTSYSARRANSSGSYTWNETSGDYNTPSAFAKFVVKKKAIARVELANKSDDNTVYNRNEYTVTLNNTANYWLSSDENTSPITITVSASVNDFKGNTKTVPVTAADITTEYATKHTFNADGSIATQGNEGYFKFTNAGTYTITVTLDDNHCWAQSDGTLKDAVDGDNTAYTLEYIIKQATMTAQSADDPAAAKDTFKWNEKWDDLSFTYDTSEHYPVPEILGIARNDSIKLIVKYYKTVKGTETEITDLTTIKEADTYKVKIAGWYVNSASETIWTKACNYDFPAGGLETEFYIQSAALDAPVLKDEENHQITGTQISRVYNGNYYDFVNYIAQWNVKDYGTVGDGKGYLYGTNSHKVEVKVVVSGTNTNNVTVKDGTQMRDVCTYTVTVRPATNFQWAEGVTPDGTGDNEGAFVYTFTITPKTLVANDFLWYADDDTECKHPIEDLSYTGYTYNGATRGLVSVVKEGSLLCADDQAEGKVTVGVTYSISDGDRKDAGKVYNAFASSLSGDRAFNYELPVPVSKQFEIQKFTVTKPEYSPSEQFGTYGFENKASYAFNGDKPSKVTDFAWNNVITAAVTSTDAFNTNGDAFDLSSAFGWSGDTASFNATYAGSYTVTFTLKNTTNYKWKVETADISVSGAVYTPANITIGKFTVAKPNYSWSDTTYVYGNTNKASYAFNGDKPSTLNASDSFVWSSVITAAVTPANAFNTNGDAFDLTNAFGWHGDTVSFNATFAGTYTVTFTLNDADNYQWATSEGDIVNGAVYTPKNIEINKFRVAVPTYTKGNTKYDPTGTNLNQQKYTLSIPNSVTAYTNDIILMSVTSTAMYLNGTTPTSYNITAADITWNGNTASFNARYAGEYAVEFTLKDTNNYMWEGAAAGDSLSQVTTANDTYVLGDSKKIIIDKYAVAVPTVAANSGTFDGSLKTITFTLDSKVKTADYYTLAISGKWNFDGVSCNHDAYTVADCWNWENAQLQVTNAGTYTATFTLKDTYNLEWAGEESGTPATRTAETTIERFAITAPKLTKPDDENIKGTGRTLERTGNTLKPVLEFAEDTPYTITQINPAYGKYEKGGSPEYTAYDTPTDVGTYYVLLTIVDKSGFFCHNYYWAENPADQENLSYVGGVYAGYKTDTDGVSIYLHYAITLKVLDIDYSVINYIFGLNGSNVTNTATISNTVKIREKGDYELLNGSDTAYNYTQTVTFYKLGASGEKTWIGEVQYTKTGSTYSDYTDTDSSSLVNHLPWDAGKYSVEIKLTFTNDQLNELSFTKELNVSPKEITADEVKWEIALGYGNFERPNNGGTVEIEYNAQGHAFSAWYNGKVYQKGDDYDFEYPPALTVIWEGHGENERPVNASDSKYKFILSGTNSDNYVISKTNVPYVWLQINKRAVTVSFEGSSDLKDVYGAELSSLSTTGLKWSTPDKAFLVVNGTDTSNYTAYDIDNPYISFKLYDEKGAYAIKDTTYPAAGSYTLRAVLKEAAEANYIIKVDENNKATIKYTIDPRAITLTLSAADERTRVYGSTEGDITTDGFYTVSCTNVDLKGASWLVGSDAKDSVFTVTSTATAQYAGVGNHNVAVTVKGNANYAVTVTGATEASGVYTWTDAYTITNATITFGSVSTNTSTYDAKEHYYIQQQSDSSDYLMIINAGVTNRGSNHVRNWIKEKTDETKPDVTAVTAANALTNGWTDVTDKKAKDAFSGTYWIMVTADNHASAVYENAMTLGINPYELILPDVSDSINFTYGGGNGVTYTFVPRSGDAKIPVDGKAFGGVSNSIVTATVDTNAKKTDGSNYEPTLNWSSKTETKQQELLGFAATFAGTYTVKFTLQDTNNYKWAAGTGVNGTEYTAAAITVDKFIVEKPAQSLGGKIGETNGAYGSPNSVKYTFAAKPASITQWNSDIISAAVVTGAKTNANAAFTPKVEWTNDYIGFDATYAGSYNVTITLNDTNNYKWADDVSTGADYTPVAINVGKAELTVNLNFSIYFGEVSPVGYNGADTYFMGNASDLSNAAYTITGFKLTDNKDNIHASGSITYTTPYNKGNGVGNYAISGLNFSNLSSSNYTFKAGTDSKLTVKALPVTVEFKDANVSAIYWSWIDKTEASVYADLLTVVVKDGTKSVYGEGFTLTVPDAAALYNIVSLSIVSTDTSDTSVMRGSALTISGGKVTYMGDVKEYAMTLTGKDNYSVHAQNGSSILPSGTFTVTPADITDLMYGINPIVNNALAETTFEYRTQEHNTTYSGDIGPDGIKYTLKNSDLTGTIKHCISVNKELSETELAAINESKWSANSAGVKHVDVYYIYYRITADNHNPEYVLRKVTITKAQNAFTSAAQFANSAGNTDSASAGDAWTYGAYNATEGDKYYNAGGYNANGDQKLTAPVPKFVWMHPDDNNGNLNKITYCIISGFVSADGVDVSTVGEKFKTTVSVSKTGSTNDSVLNDWFKGLFENGAFSAGEYTLYYSIPESKNYSATYGAMYFKVAKKELTVTVSDKSVVYGEALTPVSVDDVTGNVTYGYTVAGLVKNATEETVNDVFTDPTNVFTTEYSVGTNAGTYPFSVKENNVKSSNYDIKFVTDNILLTVQQRTVTIKIEDKTSKYNYNLSSKTDGTQDAEAATGGHPLTFTVAELAGSYGFYAPDLAGGASVIELITNATSGEPKEVNGTNKNCTLDVGVYAIFARFTDAKHRDNYNIVISGGSFTADNVKDEYGTHKDYFDIAKSYFANENRDNLIVCGEDEAIYGYAGIYKITPAELAMNSPEVHYVTAKTANSFESVKYTSQQAATIYDGLYKLQVREPAVSYGTYKIYAKYSTDNVSFDMDYVKEAGTYSLKWVVDNPNYVWASNDGNSFTVFPRIISFRHTANNGINGSAPNYSATYKNDDFGIVYTFTNLIKDVDNHVDAGLVNDTVNPAGGTQNFGFGIDQKHLTDTNTLFSSLELGASVELANNRLTLTAKNAGVYTVKVEISGAHHLRNYTFNVSAGTNPAEIKQEGDKYYFEYTFTVNRAELEVTAKNTTIQYGTMYNENGEKILDGDIVRFGGFELSDYAEGMLAAENADGTIKAYYGDDRVTYSVRDYTSGSASATATAAGAKLQITPTGVIAYNYTIVYDGRVQSHGEMTVEKRDVTVKVFGYDSKEEARHIYDGVLPYIADNADCYLTSNVYKLIEPQDGTYNWYGNAAMDKNNIPSALQVTLSISSNNLSPNVGLYGIYAASGSANYQVTFVNKDGDKFVGTGSGADVRPKYEIYKAPLTIQAGWIGAKADGAYNAVDFTKFDITYGNLTERTDGSYYYFTVRYDGFIESDGNAYGHSIADSLHGGELTFTALNGDKSYEAWVSHSGERYTVAPAGLTFHNYDITFENATMTVIPRKVIATTSDRVYTEEAGNYNGGIHGIVHNAQIIFTDSDALSNNTGIYYVYDGNVVITNNLGNVQYTDIAPNGRMLRSYTGETFGGEAYNSDSAPTKAGAYEVTVKLRTYNDTVSHYDFIFDTAHQTGAVDSYRATMAYKVEKKQLNISWNEVDTGYLNYVEGDAKQRVIEDYIRDIMNVVGVSRTYTNGNESVNEWLELASGALSGKQYSVTDRSLTVNIYGIGMYSAIIRFNDDAKHNYYWQDSDNEQFAISFRVAATSFKINMLKLVYEGSSEAVGKWTYGEVAPEPDFGINIDGVRVALTYHYALLEQLPDIENMPYGSLIAGASESSFQRRGYSTTVPTAAGVYVMRAYYPGSDTYGEAVAYLVFEIEKAEIDTPAITEGHSLDVTYTGKELSLGFEYDITLLSIAYDGRTSVTADGITVHATDVKAGGYSVAFTLRDSNNYKWAEGARHEFVWTVNPAADNAITKFDTSALESLVYSGNSAPAPAVEAKYVNDGIRVEYYVGGEWVETAPVAAGRYKVRAVSSATDNYFAGTAGTAAYSEEVEFTIKRAQLTVTPTGTAVYGTAFDKDGKVGYSLSFAGFVAGELDVTGSAEYALKTVPEKLVVDSYALTLTTAKETQSVDGQLYTVVKGLSLDNYYITVVDGEFTVTKAELYIAVGNVRATYGDELDLTSSELKPIRSELMLGDTLDDLNITLDIDEGYKPAGDNKYPVGFYVMSAAFDNPNYDITFSSGIYTVDPLDIRIEIVTQNGVYNKTAAKAEVKSVVTAADGKDLSEIEGIITPTFTFSFYGTSNDGTWTYNELTAVSSLPTLAGSYTAKAVGTLTANFNLVTTPAAGFTIEKQTVDASVVTTRTAAYTGSPITPVVNDNDISHLYTVNPVQYTEVGTWDVTLVMRDFNNYKWLSIDVEERVIPFVIEKGDNAFLADGDGNEVRISGWTFGESANAPAASTRFGSSSDYIFEYSDSADGTFTTNVPTRAGTWYVRATVPQSDNYNRATSAPVSFVIGKAPLKSPTLTIVNDGDGKNTVYTGERLQSLIRGYNPATMRVIYDGDTSVGNEVAVYAVNAGTYKVMLALIDADNYCWADDVELEDGNAVIYWTIARKKVEKPTADPNVYMVNGRTLTYKPVGFDDSIMKIDGNTTSYGGVIKVTVSLKDTVNYEWADGSVEDITFDWTVIGWDVVFIIVASVLGVVAGIAAIAIGVQYLLFRKRKRNEALAAADASGAIADGEAPAEGTPAEEAPAEEAPAEETPAEEAPAEEAPAEETPAEETKNKQRRKK